MTAWITLVKEICGCINVYLAEQYPGAHSGSPGNHFSRPIKTRKKTQNN